VYVLDHCPEAIASPKHLAGFIVAPPYPGAVPVVTYTITVVETPTSNGPIRGPNACACRGSRPTAKARKLRRVKTWSTELLGYKGQ
jgi:hypothetical protein